MAGNKEGGKKACQTNLKKHGADFYRRIGAIGGRKGHTGGFASNPELAKIAGKKGGSISRKNGKSKKIKVMIAPYEQNNLEEIKVKFA